MGLKKVLILFTVVGILGIVLCIWVYFVCVGGGVVFLEVVH